MKRNRSKPPARSNGGFRLPDLDHARAAVLSTLSSPDAQRCYRFAIDDFIVWYCSEPRLGFNKAAVLGYRLELESRHLASSTINLRLGAKLLVERGADINNRDSEFGATPAGWAIEYLRELGGHLAIELDDLAYAIRTHDSKVGEAIP